MRFLKEGFVYHELLAFDGRFISDSGQVWWKSHRAYRGDIRG
jgi:hypothetical protein